MSKSLARLGKGAVITGFAVALSATVHSPVYAQTPESHHHGFGNAEQWEKVFDDPSRDAWQKPHEVIRALALAPDSVVADIGSGTGYFSVRLARMVPKGRIYGVDTEPDMVRFLDERAKREHLGNLFAVAGTPQDPRIPGKVDVVLLVDAYHHIEARESYFRGLRASLRPQGRVALIDYRLNSREGPPKNERISPERAKDEMRKAGYRLIAQHDFLPKQYFLVFARSDAPRNAQP